MSDKKPSGNVAASKTKEKAEKALDSKADPNPLSVPNVLKAINELSTPDALNVVEQYCAVAGLGAAKGILQMREELKAKV